MRIEQRRIAVAFLFLVLLTATIAAPLRAGMVVRACFSPAKKCADHIIKEIGQAQKEILAAVYAFTSDDIAQALIKARKRGVVVQLIVDREFDRENENSKGSLLQQQGVALRRQSGVSGGKPEKGAGIMHQKFAVIDRRVVFTGSYNWTVAAERYNHENLLYFRDAGPLADEYRREFLRLWEKKS
jgi:phosphatidylserine/phosphatidylglycerophosphate/cardiolipin synthase-like enzyme